jgi:glutamine synthetase
MHKVVLEYIWLDSNDNFRSKTKIMNINNELKLNMISKWNYDGSSTGQATGTDSEIFLEPVCFFKDPFRQNVDSYLVWCSSLDKNDKYLSNSNRNFALEKYDKIKEQEPWFGLEQEYFIINPETNLPFGFLNNTNPKPQGDYYCGVGCNNIYKREIPEKHIEYCLYAGIDICGINAEVAPSQWEYQIGPSVGIFAGDHLWMSRYILNRIAELYNCNISYHPKPLGASHLASGDARIHSVNTDWNGSGCHTNFSTNKMRDENGLSEIYKLIDKLKDNHSLHMNYYGKYNKLRMSGKHETSSYDNFTIGVGNRGSSIRIPNMTLKENKGYFEDRRPASNCDPYLVTGLIMDCCINN